MSTFVVDPPDEQARQFPTSARPSETTTTTDRPDHTPLPERSENDPDRVTSTPSRGQFKRRLAYALVSFGVVSFGFCAFLYVVTPIINLRSQRSLAGELQKRIDIAAALASGATTEAPVGQEDFSFGLGDPERPELPKLTGELAADAIAELQELGYRVTTAFEPSRTLIPGLVTRTSPAGGEVAPPGTDVTVFVSTLAPGASIATLTIERIGVSEIVIEGTSSQDLMNGPGHYRDSPLPGHAGNAIVFGHRTIYGAPFRRLHELEPGDEIKVSTFGAEAVYDVVEVKVLEQGDPDVLEQDDRNILTLVTSSPPYQSSDRLAVIAELRGEPLSNSRRSNEVGEAIVLKPDERGRDWDPAAWAPAIIWGELLIAGIYLTRRIRARYSAPNTWLLAAPPLTVTSFLFFESIARLFPSTI
ncbi:MAG: sortase [Acidimicrobiales bacterium]|nr:sortase [Acidimicrobiales bacterium]